jgi:hypothetical protein
MNLKLWMDLTKPPPMAEVISTVTTHLKRDLYWVVDDKDPDHSKDQGLLSSSDSGDHSVTLDLSIEVRCSKFKKHCIRLDSKVKKEEPTKASEAKPQDSLGDTTKSDINNLAEKISQLTIAIEADRSGK